MKRLRSYGDDLGSVGEKEVDRTTPGWSSHHRRYYSKGPENGWSRPSLVIDDDREREGSVSRGVSLRKRVDHDLDGFDEREGSRGFRKRGEHEFSGAFEEREGFRGVRKRLEHENDGFDRRKGFDRYRDRDGMVGSSMVSPRGSGRDYPKGFRSERHWSRREDGGSSSWRRFDSRSKKDVEEDVKSSPVEKGGSSSSKGGGADSGGVSSSKENMRSPRGIKDKSPTWSKDSTKDSKKSVGEPLKNTKKNESMVADSGGFASAIGSGTEMEEGELQPELNQIQAPEDHVVSEPNVENVNQHAENPQVDRDVGNKLHELEISEMVKSRVADSVSVSEETKPSVCTGIVENALANDERLRENQFGLSAPGNISLDSQVKVEEHNPRSVEKPSPVNKNSKNNFDLEFGLGESNKAIVEVPKEPKPSVPVLKDKGKGVAVSSSCEDSLRENSLLVERNFIACQDDAMEGPSVRGFELFSSSAGVKVMCANSSGSKSEADKLKLEPLDLSLGLPNVSVPAASHSAAAPPSSPLRARSVQSFGTTLRTGSDCFTTSISFSGSQFIHNPSCSLTHNSVDHDFEQSVKSRPLFQGVNWQALSANDSLPKEILANSKSVSNGHVNGSLHFTQSSQGILNGRAIQQQAVPVGVDRSGSLQKQPSGKIRYQDDFRSPAQSAGSHDNRSEFGKSERRVTGEESVSRLFRSSSQREMEQGLAGERDLVERLIYLIASEHIQIMARRLNEMPERAVAFLKDSVCEVILKEDNHRKLRGLQDVLRKRSDLNLETLLKSHRVQLQSLVALKTGLTDYIQRADSISSSDLAEIFLSLKCRNVNCRSALPVDECDCKFCSKKDGYCSSCMCLVCSKFDTASNTCGWVGCDVCNHWCHTDCGLLKSYIRNGRSTAGAQGVSEMQFYCLACDHPSEMFGFVKDVFKTCATEWKAETFLRELEYVRRIFSASNDYRGKVLHDAAKQLIGRLQSGAKTVEICNQIMAFLNEGDAKLANAVGSSGRDQVQPQPLENKRVNVQDGATVRSHEPIWSKSTSAKEFSQMENIGNTLPSIEGRSVGGGSWSTEMLMGMSSKTGDELDIVKLKLAEAQLFQKRADAARAEAEGLQRIAIAKNEKAEEEYTSRIAKLRLSEVEERRRLKHEELQMLERSHREYFHMKTRMETDIKDLLIKMEATRRNLST
uniref:Zinc finger PHD-type domain-containing protein n=1 Tax=Chenopodium quinoa TaxID=63459 RepID=A0A803KM81_CHEQI